MKCERCGKEFAAKRSTRKFCSDACRQRNHRPNWVEKYNKLVGNYNDLQAEFKEAADKANAELTRLYDQVDLLLAGRALDKAVVDEAAQKLIK